MRYLIFAAIPASIFIGTILTVWILEFCCGRRDWWSAPLYMTFMVCIVAPIMVGGLLLPILYFAGALS